MTTSRSHETLTINSLTERVKKQRAKLSCRDVWLLSRELKQLRTTEDLSEKLSALELRLEEKTAALAQRRQRLPEISYPEELPVSARRAEIIEAIRSHQVVVVAGETGSGKTTQLPKMCLEAGLGVRGLIGHTQPRRIAARAVAQRLAEEFHESLGQSVGYKVRFSDVSSPDIFVKLMTDGMLLSELASDRLLLSYDCIIIDEAHERSLNIDFLLGYLKNLLARRRDLKLIITSATIDVERFSEHFDHAPILEVSGRTYPVEVLYAPPTGDGEEGEDEEELPTSLPQQVLETLKSLYHDYGRGDTLVFLPGERDIMEMAAFLSRSDLKGVEILPLYARLASSEQGRIFAPHSTLRVVLATNVAETSLTVPGIRFVIDPGLARISRYSPRLKVQRLPVEKISKASAEQRKGRCGRVSAGVCVRLYSEEDFAERDEYTDPEVRRTNLAAVVLQMTALRLGAVSTFPFIDPPAPRQISDGIRLLEELGAIEPDRSPDEVELTALGRDLWRFPADPRLARMLIEAQRQGALSELLIIVAALSVMDPRLTPPDHLEASRNLHHRFDDEQSDFLSYLKLYHYLTKLQSTLSNAAFRRLLKKEYLSYLRVREWFDVLRQLRATCRVLKLTPNEAPAGYEQVHKAVISGLLSQCGVMDENDKGLYLGARGLKFALHPSSGLSKRRPKWVCAAELTETSRLFGRTLAKIDPLWLEGPGQRLIKKSYQEPHWSRKDGAVKAVLTVTLFGLTLESGRQVLYSAVDPALCRTLMIREALVGGEIDRSYPFLQRNRALVESVRAEEDRQRRRDLLADESVLEDFYAQRLPQEMVTVRHLDKFWRLKQKSDPHCLDFSLELITRNGALPDQRALFPDYWISGELRVPLSYVFDPGNPQDGVSAHIPLAVLNKVRERDFLYQVPGLREELFTELIRSLPKRLRRNLIPAPEYAKALYEAVAGSQDPFYERLCHELTRMGGERVYEDDFDLKQIPDYLKVNFIIEDESGKVLMQGRDFAALARTLQGQAREALDSFRKEQHERGRLEQVWRFGTIQKVKRTRQGALDLTVYPALTEHKDGVRLELYETAQAQGRAMWQGQRALLKRGLKSPASYLEDHLPNKAKLAMYYRPLGTIAELIDDLCTAAVDLIMVRKGAPVWNESEFAALQQSVRGSLNDTALEIALVLEQILSRTYELKGRLKQRFDLSAALIFKDVSDHLDSLVYQGFLAATPYEHLKDIPRYLEAAAKRLERAVRESTRDLGYMRILQGLYDEYRGALTRYRQNEAPDELLNIRWMLEELKVSYYAQQLGVKGPVSDKRVHDEIVRVLAAHEAHF